MTLWPNQASQGPGRQESHHRAAVTHSGSKVTPVVQALTAEPSNGITPGLESYGPGSATDWPWVLGQATEHPWPLLTCP